MEMLQGVILSDNYDYLSITKSFQGAFKFWYKDVQEEAWLES